MMQKTKGLVTARVTLSNGKRENLESVLSYLPESVVINKMTWHNNKNQNELILDITYGAVWGGWQSDVSKHFGNANRKAGTSAQINITNYKRTIVDRR